MATRGQLSGGALPYVRRTPPSGELNDDNNVSNSANGVSKVGNQRTPVPTNDVAAKTPPTKHDKRHLQSAGPAARAAAQPVQGEKGVGLEERRRQRRVSFTSQDVEEIVDGHEG